jgi:hypothetical protein
MFWCRPVTRKWVPSGFAKHDSWCSRCWICSGQSGNETTSPSFSGFLCEFELCQCSIHSSVVWWALGPLETAVLQIHISPHYDILRSRGGCKSDIESALCFHFFIICTVISLCDQNAQRKPTSVVLPVCLCVNMLSLWNRWKNFSENLFYRYLYHILSSWVTFELRLRTNIRIVIVMTTVWTLQLWIGRSQLRHELIFSLCCSLWGEN